MKPLRYCLLTLPLVAALMTYLFRSSNASAADTAVNDNTAEAAPDSIDTVRNGVLPGYNITTIGRALEGTFQDSQWTSYVSPKGVTVVQFDGSISASALRRGGLNPPSVGVQVAGSFPLPPT